jgi:hypothetical protein
MPRLTNTEHALSSSLFTPLTIDRLANLEKLVITGTGLNTVPLSTVLCRLSKLQARGFSNLIGRRWMVHLIFPFFNLKS